MSRCYSMHVTVRRLLSETDGDHAREALSQLWTWDDDPDAVMQSEEGVANDFTLSLWGESSLCGGETEEHFAQRCYEAVLRAVRRPVEIEVVATFLENLPFETYTLMPDQAMDMLEGIVAAETPVEEEE